MQLLLLGGSRGGGSLRSGRSRLGGSRSSGSSSSRGVGGCSGSRGVRSRSFYRAGFSSGGSFSRLVLAARSEGSSEYNGQSGYLQKVLHFW
ncbi:hypothetical protein EU556_19200 [Hymenobacter fodinae]|uniref:Keratin type II head domain-containing protein n=1 Tax=Hymenobacter fodinae TaxID=2510796 RepID=A0A4Z0P270_9BACT|nr:hypothetical protein EU556_19200 [Hymenobacter fodinae]